MKPKQVLKTLTDIAMTAALFFLMGYQFWGELAHEWVGAALFVLFILHHVLNRKWYSALFAGRYSPVRIFQTVVDFLVLLSMLILMYSGIVLSRHLFAFLPINSGLALARKLHILGSYWGFLLMGLHLGLHWNMFIGMVKKKMRKVSQAKFSAVFPAGAVIAVYGGYVLIKRDIFSNLFLQSEFVFLDYEEPSALFYLDYLVLMGFCIFVAHYVAKFLRGFTKKNKGV